jgi:hypothetical protein
MRRASLSTGSGDIPGHWPTSAAGHPTGGARRLGSVVSGDAHLCACVLRREARDYVQCDAPRFCGIPSKWNIERQPMRPARKNDAALTSIGLREGDELLHLARGPNFEFHARSIGPYLRDGRSRSRDIRERSRSRTPPRLRVDWCCHVELVRRLGGPIRGLVH